MLFLLNYEFISYEKGICATQIRRVSRAGKLVVDRPKRDGQVLTEIEACKIFPENETKADLENLVMAGSIW